MKKLLIIAHTPSGNTQLLANALLAGASNREISNVEPVVLSPFVVKPDDVISADGIVLFTTENFGYMNGGMKEFFYRCYYLCLEETQALPSYVIVSNN